MEGQPLYYFAIAARKNADIPAEFFDRFRRHFDVSEIVGRLEHAEYRCLFVIDQIHLLELALD